MTMAGSAKIPLRSTQIGCGAGMSCSFTKRRAEVSRTAVSTPRSAHHGPCRRNTKRPSVSTTRSTSVVQLPPPSILRSKRTASSIARPILRSCAAVGAGRVPCSAQRRSRWSRRRR